ncbi:MAG: hypothetical protein JWO30_4010 [Fibrobacteres bacterium]|nr:hypothetical protein [Fibrobacterota bacterium]
MMTAKPRVATLALLLGSLSGWLPPKVHAQFEGIDKHKLTVKAYVDYGHVVNGYNYYDPDQKYDISWLPLNRLNVSVTQDVAIGRFDVSAGLSGLIWWPYGLGKDADLTEKVMQVKPMVPVARARWQFGDPASTAGSVMLGTFNYKYNPDAKNLGEYLYRSGTYPGLIWTGEGWLMMNRAGNNSHGLMATITQFGGSVKHNFSLLMETVTYPTGDFSPGYDVSLTSKWLDVGAGGVFYRYLPLRPSLLEAKDAENTYATIHGTNSAGVDTVATGRLSEIQNTVANPTETDTLDHWTVQGIKLMARAALNLGSLLPENIRGPEDLRIFAEIALLGVKNYPLYYEKRSERIPVMFGITLPTAKLLDVFTIQGEYYGSPYSDGLKYISESRPIPQTRSTPSGQTPPTHGDDLKWSIYGKKTINTLCNIYAQAASDQFRLTDGKYNPSTIPLTTSWKHDWYYVLRLEFNLR